MFLKGILTSSSLKSKKLILLTDVEGVLDAHGSLVTNLTVEEAQNLTHNNTIAGGMIPKIQCCVDAVRDGVEKAHIIDGRKEHALLLEIFTDEGIGTEIVLH